MAELSTDLELSFEFISDISGAPLTSITNPSLYLKRPGADSFARIPGVVFTLVANGAYTAVIPAAYMSTVGIHFAVAVCDEGSSKDIEEFAVDTGSFQANQDEWLPFVARSTAGVPLKALIFSSVTVTLPTGVKTITAPIFSQMLATPARPTPFYLIKFLAAEIAAANFTYVVQAAGMLAYRNDVAIEISPAQRVVVRLTPVRDAVTVEFRDADDVVIAVGETDGAGEAILEVPLGDYTIRLAKEGFQFTTNNVAVSVLDDTALINLSGAWSSATAAPTDFCKITFKLYGADGKAMADVKVHFFPSLLVTGAPAGILKQPLTVITNPMGDGTVFLVRGLQVRVNVEGTRIHEEFTVPNAATANLFDLISFVDKGYAAYIENFPAAPRRTLI